MNKIFLLLLAVVLFSAFAAGPSAGAAMEQWEVQFYDMWELWDLPMSSWDPYVQKLYDDMKAQHTQNATATPTSMATVSPTTAVPTASSTPATVVPTTALPTASAPPATVSPTTAVPTASATPATAVPTTVPTTAAPATPTVNSSVSPAPSIPVIPIIIGIVVILLAGILAVAVIRRRSAAPEKDRYVPVESVYDFPTVEEKPATPVSEAEPEDEVPVPEPEIIEPEEKPMPAPEPVKIVPKTILPPEESYAKVAACISKRYGVRRADTLTPRQLIASAEPSRELSEFVSLYERIKYSPTRSVHDVSRLSELADIITELYSS